ncbi:MAG: NAD(P)/FAD-dependent oxidoreductase [Intestinimonas sp.]
MENWPGTLSISGPDFAMGLYQQCTELGAEIQFAAVTGFEDRGDRKTVRAGEQIFEGRTFILANGVRRRKLEVPGEERLGGRGVSYCATCDGSFFKGKDVAVVGGGNTAVEDAIYLASICPTVWLYPPPGQLHRPAVSAGQPGLQAERQAPHGTPGAGDSGRQAGGESAPERAGEPAHPPCGWGIRCGGTHPGQRHVSPLWSSTSMVM